MVNSIVVFLGTRPEAIKLAPVIKEFSDRGIKPIVVSTGQHNELLKPMLDWFGIKPNFDLNLMVESQEPSQFVSKALFELGSLLQTLDKKPRLIIVQGDTNCLSPESYVEIDGGLLKRIKNVVSGDLVKTHTGLLKRVIATKQRAIGAQKAYKITVSSLSAYPVVYSSEHPILAIKRENKVSWRLKRGNFKPIFIKAEKLERGDYVLYPRPKCENKDILQVKNFLSDDERTNKNGKKIFINETVDLKEGFASFLGFYTAEGWTSKNRIGLAFNVQEVEYIHEIEKIVRRILNKEVKYRNASLSDKCVELHIQDRQLCALVKKLIPNKARNKYLTKPLMEMSERATWEFISSYAKGDGCFFLDSGKPRFNFRTASFQLAYQIRLLLLKLGIVASVQKQKGGGTIEIRGRKTVCKDSYHVNIRGQDALLLGRKIFRIEREDKNKRTAKWTYIDNDFVYMKVNSIEEVLCTEVVGLEIENDHTFCVAGVATHNTALAGALAAFYNKIPVAHIEAGLRTKSKYEPFPEEMNRRLISQIAKFHFCPSHYAWINLAREGISGYDVGNTGIDALRWTRERIDKDVLGIENIDLIRHTFLKWSYVLITLHRRETFGDPLRNICRAIKASAQDNPNVSYFFPIHPNPEVKLIVNNELKGIENIKLIEPIDYPLFIAALINARLVLTDSGGVQEESGYLGIPMVVCRNRTERLEVVECGVAALVGNNDSCRIQHTMDKILQDNEVHRRMSVKCMAYGDGFASKKIVNRLIDDLELA